jgi:DASH complex subunit DAD1
VLNRKLEEVLGMTKEYETIAALWLSFYQLMHNYGQDDEVTEEPQPGMPGTGGYLVSTKQSTSTSKND